MLALDDIIAKKRLIPYFLPIIQADVNHLIMEMMENSHVIKFANFNDSMVFINKTTLKVWFIIDNDNHRSNTNNSHLLQKGIETDVMKMILDKYFNVLNELGIEIDVSDMLLQTFKFLFGNQVIAGTVNEYSLCDEVQRCIDTFILGEVLKYAC